MNFKLKHGLLLYLMLRGDQTFYCDGFDDVLLDYAWKFICGSVLQSMCRGTIVCALLMLLIIKIIPICFDFLILEIN